jgi:hypothetical protein
MITSRKALLEKLRMIAPGLSDSDLLPVNKCFQFTGEHIVAENEKIALIVPKRCDFSGAIPGEILLDLLARSSASTVALLPNDRDEVLIRLGDDSELALPWQPYLEQLVLPHPPQHNLVAGVTAEFCRGVAYCLKSVSAYARTPDQLGVTVIADGRELRLFATNKKTISYAKVLLPQVPPGPVPQHTLLPAEFCQQLLRLAAQAQTVRLGLYDDHALFAADEVLLFGRLIAVENPLEFDDTLTRFLPRDFNDKAIPIPKKLRAVLQRADRITGIKGADVKTRVTVSDGQATFCSRSARGQAADRLALPGHPDVDIRVSVDLLLKGLRGAERVLISERVAILSSGNGRIYLASVYDDD